MAENEMVFRNLNQKVEKGFKELEKIAKEDGQEGLIEHKDIPFQFYCECSDENCRERISMKLSEYTKVHKKKRNFIILPRHSINTIEHVLQKTPMYWVVEKFIDLPPKATGLNATSVDNS
jgi:hypothetical protein